MPKPNSDCRATVRKHPGPMVRLGDVCEVRAGANYKDVEDPNGRYPIYGTGGIMGRASQYRCPAHSIIVGRKGTLDNPFLVHEPFWNIDTCFGVVPSEKIIPEYLFRFCQGFDFYSLVPASGRPSTTSDAVRSIEIPLPSLSEQKEIVVRLERELAAVEKMKNGFETMAETAKAEFKAELKEVFEEISRGGAETRRLGEIGRVAMCKRVLKAQTSENGDVPFFKIGTFGKEPNAYISNELFREFVKKFSYPKKGDVLISAAGTIGRTIVFDGKPSYFQDSNIVWLEHDGTMATNEYLHCFYWSKPWKVSDGATIPRIYNGDIESAEIPLPSLPVQRQIVTRLSTAKARAEKLEAKARDGVAVCATMRKSILKEAFESSVKEEAKYG